MKRSLRHSIFYVTFLLSLLPLTSVGLSLLFTIQDNAETSAKNSLSRKLDDVVASMDHELELISARALALGRDKDVVLGAKSLLMRYQAAEQLETFFDQNPSVGKIGLLSVGDDFVVSEPKALRFLTGTRLQEQINAAKHEFVKNPNLAYTAKVMDVSDVYTDLRLIASNDTTEKAAVVVIVPLMEEYLSGDLSGLLVCVVPVQNLLAISKSKLGSSLGVSIRKKSNKAVESQTMQIGKDEVRMSKRWAIAGVSDGPDLDYAIEISETYVRYSSLFINTFRNAALLFACMLILVAMLTYYFARYLTRPISKISRSVNEFSLGHYDFRSDNLTYTELHDIEETLAEMGSQIKARINALEEKAKVEAELRVAKTLTQLASQVAHDIRSPVALLNAVLAATETLPPEKRDLMRRGINRINEIANDLLQKRQIASGPFGLASNLLPSDNTVSVPEVLEEIVQEKSALLSPEGRVSFDFRRPAYDALVGVNILKKDLMRVLSNLLNNAIEAIKGKGNIGVSYQVQDGYVGISILDEGCGMPEHVMRNLFREGFSFAKQGGSGLGLFDAVQKIKAWGGLFTIVSSSGRGTYTYFEIPLLQAQIRRDPIELAENLEVLVADDDLSIHDLWRSKFAGIAAWLPNLRIRHVSSPEAVTAYVQKANHRILFLVDHEFINSPMNGVNLIDALKIHEHAYLITGRADDPTLQNTCKEKGIRLLSKVSLPHTGFSLPASERKRVVVLLDDEVWVRSGWMMMAEKLNIPFAAFASSAELFNVLHLFSTDSIFFFDSNLNEERKGEDIAHDIYNAGFTNLYLSTGMVGSELANLPWIKKVVGKDFPEDIRPLIGWV